MILQAVLILGGVGLTFAILIAIANRRLKVWEDPRIDIVAGLLPNANCGACGLPGCRAFAEQAVEGKVQPAQCTVSSDAGIIAIAAFLGVDRGTADKRVARLRCAGGHDVALQRAEYRGLKTCAAANAVSGGGKGCAWGCLGFGDCAEVCDFGAISMNAFGLPVVDTDKCTACGDCVTECPKDLFFLTSLGNHLLVQCRNLINGDDALEACKVACTSCGRCVIDGAAGLISIATGVAEINYELIAMEEHRAVERCPTGAIVWLQGAQFATSAPPIARSAVA